jgi:hypothetical protein
MHLHPYVKGLNKATAAGTGREKMAKTFFLLRQLWQHSGRMLTSLFQGQ